MANKKSTKKTGRGQKSSNSATARSRSSSPKRSSKNSAGVKGKNSRSPSRKTKSQSRGRAQRLSPDNPEIKILSRYGVERTIRYVDKNRATVTGDSRFMRFSTNHETGIVDFADFEGGPTVAVGERIHGAGVVSSVEKWEYTSTGKSKVDRVAVTFRHDATG